MKYSAYYIQESEGDFSASIAELDLIKPEPGFVQIQVSHSSLNYKDALSATGVKGITRNYPFVPGIDAAGVVTDSASKLFNVGDEVIVTGYDLGMNTPGGFGEFISVPEGWIVQKPENLSALETMSIGTAGITAAASVIKIIDSKPTSELPIIVTGATGGVGSVAVMILAKLGFNVCALTGKTDAHNFLTQLGATSIIHREDYLNEPFKPMVRPLYAGAIDTVGGSILSKLLSEIAPHGVVSCCGNVGGIEINTTVFPFILRGISLCGIDSAESPIEFKKSLWKKFANEWRLDLFASTKVVNKEQLSEEIQIILQGGQQGRVVLNHKE
tara:strand:+ start:2246 stop:3229 length:984 start_codon:yes stop_codon:yes gene_type:complete